MQPVMSKSLSVTALTLRDLIFMVRENQILPTGMNIDFLTQIFFLPSQNTRCAIPDVLHPMEIPRKGSPSFFGFSTGRKSSGSSF